MVSATSAEGSPALRCQRAIENGGRRYLEAAFDVATECLAAGGSAGDINNCMFEAFETDDVLEQQRLRLSRRTARRCQGTDVFSDLGYYAMCPGDDLRCHFATSEFDAPGDDNDVLDCIACQMRNVVRRTTVKLYQGTNPLIQTAAQAACVATIGSAGFAAFRVLTDKLRRCLRRRSSSSIASCIENERVSSRVEAAISEWRAAAVAGCPAVSWGSTLTYGYSKTCDGTPPFPGQPCLSVVTPCLFSATSNLDAPGGENDLLDCLTCRVEEGGLSLARYLQGANLCCIGATCNKVMTRRACQLAGGHPAYYQIDSEGSLGFNLPHGITFAPDGTLYVADHNSSQTAMTVSTVPPGGSPTVLATLPVTGIPTGIALDSSENAYVAAGCENQVVYKVSPVGDIALFAGTVGVAGHAGDGGLATDALLAGIRKVAVDPTGNVYITESGTLTLGCPAPGVVSNAEYVRMVDTNGIIQTVAGVGPYGTGGIDGPALSAQFGLLLAMTIAPDGSMLLGEGGAQRVLRIDPLPPAGTVTHVAGRATNPIGAFSGDGGPARLARFFSIEGIVQDADGNVIVSDFQNNRLRLIDTGGSVITIAGNGATTGLPGPGSGDGGPGELALLGCPQEAALAPDGRIWFHNQLGARYFRTLTRVLF